MKFLNHSSALIHPLHTILFSCHLKTETSHVFICQHIWYSGVQTQNKSLCSFLASLSWRQKLAGLFSCCSRVICFLYNSSLSLIDNCAYLTTFLGDLTTVYFVKCSHIQCHQIAHDLDQMWLVYRKSNSSKGLDLDYSSHLRSFVNCKWSHGSSKLPELFSMLAS